MIIPIGLECAEVYSARHDADMGALDVRYRYRGRECRTWVSATTYGRLAAAIARAEEASEGISNERLMPNRY